MARRPKNLGEKLMMSTLATLGDHVWESSPELRNLASAFGFTHPVPKDRREAPEEPPTEKKCRKPKRRWTASPPEESSDEDVVELERKPDGSYGPR